MPDTPAPPEDMEIVVDGEVLDSDALSFREQREVRALVRNELIGDPDADLDDMALVDFLPALIYVYKKRDDPSYTLDQALDLRMSDVMRPVEKGKRPTRAAKAAKTR